jgi:hypothetical protein
MKIRGGFVSNSSSTSFMIVVNDDVLKENDRIFSTILNALSMTNVVSKKSIKTLRDELVEQIDTCCRDINYLDDKLTYLYDVKRDKRLCDAVVNVIETLEKSHDVQASRRRRHERQMPTLDGQINDIKRLKCETEYARIRAQKRLNDISGFNDDDSYMTWTEQNHNSLGLGSAAESLSQSGVVKILERTST